MKKILLISVLLLSSCTQQRPAVELQCDCRDELSKYLGGVIIRYNGGSTLVFDVDELPPVADGGPPRADLNGVLSALTKATTVVLQQQQIEADRSAAPVLKKKTSKN